MYKVKKQGTKYKVYNTKRKAYLKKEYDTRNSAKTGLRGLKKRVEGVKKYHGCCKRAKCGKSNNENTTSASRRRSSGASSTSNTTRARRRRTPATSSTSNINRRREEQPRASAATQDMLSELDRIADTIRTPSRRPRNKRNRRRITPTPLNMTSDFGVTSLPSGGTSGQRRTAGALEELSKRASTMDRLMSGIVFTT